MSAGHSADETEETIHQHLQELGLLEDGMSLDDKRSLWEVIKLSKDTAHAEEQDRQKRARNSLQFDEISSRSEISKDVEIEEEKQPIMKAMSPQLRSSSQGSPQPNTSSVRPSSCHSPSSSSVSSSSKTCTAPSSPLQQSSSVEFQSRETLKPVEPSVRRCLRSRTVVAQFQMNEVQEVSQTQNSQSSRNSLSPANIRNSLSQDIFETQLSPHSVQGVTSPRSASPRSINNSPSPQRILNVPSPRNMSVSSPKPEQEYHSKHETEGSSKKWSLVMRDGNESNLPSSSAEVMELPAESPKSSDHESSPVRRLSKGIRVSLNFQQTDENIEESCALSEKDKTDNVPSPGSVANEGQSPPVDNSRVNDKERNIDAFNCDRSTYGLTLKIRKPRRTCSRLPFYIPPYKMDVQMYTAYFKKCISDHAAKLLQIQRKSHKCIPWGDPFVVGEVDSNAVVSLEPKNNMTAMSRYSLRGRKATQQKVDTIFEDTETQNDIKAQDDNDEIFDSLLEEEKPSENIQITKKEESQEDMKTDASPSDRQGAKRKSESGDEMDEKRPATGVWLSTDKIEEEETAVKRKKLGTGEDKLSDSGFDKEVQVLSQRGPGKRKQTSKAMEVPHQQYFSPRKTRLCNGGPAKSWKDLGLKIPKNDDEDFEPSNKVSQQNKRGKKRKQRKLFTPQTTATDVDNNETNIYDDLSELNDGNSPPRSQQEVDIIKPGPVKLRRRGRNQPQPKSQKNETEVSVVYEGASDSNKEQDMEVPCPICRVAFPSKDIEAHASDCNQYCAEEILEGDERSPSPQILPEECWTQYDDIHETNTQSTAASKHSYGAT